MKHVKFEEKIKENIVHRSNQEQLTPCMGIVVKYDREKHQVDVMTARPDSHQMGEMYTGLPCPQNNGVQSVAPEQGRPCWLSFPSGTKLNPIVVAFFNPYNRENDYDKYNVAVNDTPRFMMEM